MAATQHHTDGFHFEGSIAVVGGGRMGEAIIGGLVEAGVIRPEAITVADPSAKRRTELETRFGVTCVAESDAMLPADVVIIAVKPQVIDAIISEISSLLGTCLVISIAAGVTSARLEALLPAGTAVVRVMPNTPALVGEGMSVVSGGSEATAEQVDLVRALFATFGRSIVIDEQYQNAATAISGSGPAYFALIVDALARAGVRHGLTRGIAQALAVQTMRGTASLIEEAEMSPSELIDGVSSPGGTTIAAIEVLETYAVRSAFAEAVSANIERAEELGS